VIAAGSALVRFSALGFSMTLPLIGVAAAAESTVPTVVLAVVIGVALHIFAYVLNDIVDLPLDRTNPRRAANPLVTGLVSPTAALTLAMVMLGVALSAAAQAGADVLAAVAAAALGLGAYDLLGKRTRWPWLADGVQGLGWGSLVLAGASSAGGMTPLAFAIAGYIAVFIVMANGVHGAIRDLPSDSAYGIRTTAQILGARAANGTRAIPRLVMAYAWILQAALLAVTAVAIASAGSFWAVPLSGVAILLLAAAFSVRTDGDLLAAGMLHLLVGLAIPIALVAESAPPELIALLVVLYTTPVLSHRWLPGALAWGGRSAARAIRYAADIVRSTRPHNATAAGVAVIIGAYLGGRSDLVAEPVLSAALVAWLVVAAGNIANDRVDVVEDRINRPTRPIASGRVSLRFATWFAVALATAGCLLALTLGAAPAVATLVLIGVAFLYSSHLKGTPILGNTVVAALSTSTIVFGALVLASPTLAVASGAACVLISVASTELLKDAADRDGDRAAGRTTIATRLSIRDCLRLYFVLAAALIALVMMLTFVGAAPPSFFAASLAGVVAPQLVLLARLREAGDADAIRRVLPLSKVAWFTGLASLVFLV